MSKIIIFTEGAPAPIGPYSQAVLANGVLYVSGQVAINPTDGLIETKDIVSETHQVMKNLSNILLKAGFDFKDIVKTTIFVKDLNNFALINDTYSKYFVSDPPARETVEVSRLPKDVNVEISCIAAK